MKAMREIERLAGELLEAIENGDPVDESRIRLIVRIAQEQLVLAELA
jgi:hypothetical protein